MMRTYGSRIWNERTVLPLVLVFTLACAWWKWVKLNSLLWLDPAWWLNEYGRYAAGELPYRDFYWPYGPLSAQLFAWPMRMFGERFVTVQIVMDILSALVVLLVYLIARRLMPFPLPQFTVITLVSVGITARVYFSLFSLISYTPAVHSGAVGVLLMLWAMLAYLNDGRRRIFTIATGAWIACLSKQETLLAAVVLIISITILDFLKSRPASLRSWIINHLLLAFACFSIPAISYLGWIIVAGWPKFSACFQAFGLASLACPWWPNGFGLAGALEAIARAAIIVSCLGLFVPSFRKRIGVKYSALGLAWLCAFAFVVWFEWRSFALLFTGRGPITARVEATLTDLLATSAMLRPVLWCGYLYLVVIVARVIRRRQITATQLGDVLLLIVPGIMSIRSLFGSILAHDLEVPAIAYPFLLLVGPYLLYRGLLYGAGADQQYNRPAVVATSSVLILYSIVRLVGGYSTLLSDRAFEVVETPAGDVRLREAVVERNVIRYILENTTRSDTLLELPFGGGMSFATKRKSPTYSTLFIQLHPPTEIQKEDLARLKARPPEIVIAPMRPNLGTMYGVEGTVACVFPKFVWQGDKQSCDPAYIFPIVNYIQENYRVDRKIGEWLLFRPLRPLPR